MNPNIVIWRQRMFDRFKADSPDVADYKIWEWVDEMEKLLHDTLPTFK